MEIEKIRVLVVSYLPWGNDVSVGNTLSNLFNGLQDRIEFANIYFKGGKPQNEIASHHFYIPEKELAKSIITRKVVGGEITVSSFSEVNVPDKTVYSKARQMRWESMLLVQDLIGLLGNWKSKDLEKFISDFQPDLIFGPLGRVPVANVLMKYIHEKYGTPVIAYAWDDHYSLKKKSWSLFFWLKTLLERKYIKKCASACSYLYTITEPMMYEYKSYFNKECRLLYKYYDFCGDAPVKKETETPIKIVYMGNIGSGRWKVLAKTAKAVAEINENSKKAELYIYTMSPKSDEVETALSIKGSSYLMDPVPNEEVLRTMKSADILLHVEPTNEKDRLFFRLSFSTKLVDYLYNARCIFAIGGQTAATDYLKNNDAAVVELNEKNIKNSLEELLNSPQKIIEYGYKAWACGVKNHQRQTMQERLYDDFTDVARRKVCVYENR